MKHTNQFLRIPDSAAFFVDAEFHHGHRPRIISEHYPFGHSYLLFRVELCEMLPVIHCTTLFRGCQGVNCLRPFYKIIETIIGERELIFLYI